MDGNGRWAKQKGLFRTLGHREGILRVKEVVASADDFGVEALTLFAFSSENWKRPKREINVLMNFFVRFLDAELPKMLKRNIKFRVIGRAHPLPASVLKKIREAEERTAANTGLTLVIAVNYGSRTEIVDAVKTICQKALKGECHVSDIDEETFGDYLYTKGVPDPDLLIRTSGEERISNFLLWQLSYTELLFIKKCWPDFKKADLEEAIKEYQHRQRRFGNI